MGNQQSTHRALVRTHEQFSTREILGSEPMILEKCPENAQAYAHSLHLATFEYPEAFGTGHRAFSVEDARNFFLHRYVTTFGIGEDNCLLAGVSTIYQGPDLGAWSLCSSEAPKPAIDLLFKHRSLGTAPVGRILGAKALEHLLGHNVSEITVSVTNRNRSMHRVYKRMGFCEVGTSVGKGCKIIHMKLAGQEQIAEISNKLKS